MTAPRRIKCVDCLVVAFVDHLQRIHHDDPSVWSLHLHALARVAAKEAAARQRDIQAATAEAEWVLKGGALHTPREANVGPSTLTQRS